MKTSRIFFPIAQLTFVLGISGARAATLEESLTAAVLNSEKLQSAKLQERVAETKVDLAKSGYRPDIQAQAIDSTGFAGSTGALGVGGVMGSPYRSGWGYGIVATQPIFDFGKTSRNVEGARAEVDASRAQTEFTKSGVMGSALDTYIRCAVARSELKNWTEIKELTDFASREVRHFVKTGQRSVVDEMLARVQYEGALRAEAASAKELELVRKQISLITGWPLAKSDCLSIDDLNEGAFVRLPSSGKSSIELAADANLHLAELNLKAARGAYLPKLVALASVGDLENVRLVQKTDYSLGVALTIPLFDSGRTNADVDRNLAILDQRTHEKKAARQYLDEINLKFDQEIATAEAQLEHLKIELHDTVSALDVAKKRYFTMSGHLADLREAIRNFSQVKSQLAKSQATLIRASVAKAIVNGWQPSP